MRADEGALNERCDGKYAAGVLRVTVFNCNHFSNYTQRHTKFCRTPLDEGSARRSNLYPTTHNTHKGQTTVPLAGIETGIPETAQQQTLA